MSGQHTKGSRLPNLVRPRRLSQSGVPQGRYPEFAADRNDQVCVLKGHHLMPARDGVARAITDRLLQRVCREFQAPLCIRIMGLLYVEYWVSVEDGGPVVLVHEGQN